MAVNSLPQFAERVLIFGDGPLAESLVAELGARPELGLRVVGQLKSHENGNENLRLSSGENSDDQFLNLIESYNAKKIVVAMNERRGNLPVQPLLQLKSRGVSIQDGAEIVRGSYWKASNRISPHELVAVFSRLGVLALSGDI